MTVNDSANLPDDGGSKTVESLSLENPNSLNFAELEDEDPQANQDQADEGDGSEQDDDYASPDDPDDSGPDDEGQNSEDAGDEPDESAKFDDTVVTLKSGEQVPVKELKLGYMRERDYRMKTQDVATSRRSLDDLTNRVASTAHAIASFLAEQLPEEPKTALAISNPDQYTRDKAIYDEALAQVNKVMEMGAAPKAVAQQLTKEQRAEMLAREDAALADAFPETTKPEGRKKFFEEAFDTARDLGFTDAEMAQNVDHRYFKLAHYARIGMQAESAKKRALTKVNNAPAVVPKGKAQGQNAQQARTNKDAMRRLTKTGSIKDAMMIDFD